MSENSKKSSDPQIVLMAEQAQKTQSKQGKYKRKIFIIVVVLLVLVGCLVLWRLFSTDSNKTAVFTIEDKAYSSEEVDSLIAYPVSNGSNKDGAARQVYYYLKRQAAAKKANFEPSAKAIEDSKADLFKDSDNKEKNSKWADLRAYDAALEKGLPKVTPLDGVKGHIFVFYFGNLIETGENWKPTNAGDKTAIAEDRRYAKQQAELYREQLESKQTDEATLLAKLNADTKLNYQYKTDNNMSLSLNPQVAQRKSVPNDIINYVVGEAPIGISKVRTGQTYKINYRNPTKLQGQETYYYFTVLEDKGSVAKNAAFNNAFGKLHATYKGFSK